MKILVLNAGSSSIKYQLFDMPDKSPLAAGSVEKIGEEQGAVKYRVFTREGAEKVYEEEAFVTDHSESLKRIVDLLLDKEYGVINDAKEIVAVGHRVVHGGEQFSEPIKITEEVLETLRKLSYLAPLHNPANIKGIEVASDIFKDSVQVAVFDTAFHQSMPDCAYRYAVPEWLYAEQGLRAFGFHGTSHQYVSKEAAQFMSMEASQFNAISIHLGNGCSMTAIRNGESVDTTMGLTPLGGLVMGTRSGDIDPSLILFMAKHLDMTMEEIDHLLNKESGLKGLAGSNDLRDVLKRYNQQDPGAQLAVAMYVYRIKKYIGAYAAALGRVDALIFTAGVGENSAFIREKVCEELSILGIELDSALNNAKNTREIRAIETSESKVKVLVVPTNEELEIATQTLPFVKKRE
jgi:acetate kinase